ncbi:hypothetical protein [Haliea sp. E17]|uniref:hypothetical protein n=1 Tax=Haliea sp. E17 TaxID=3401576 RepID=UPI003AADDC3F
MTLPHDRFPRPDCLALLDFKANAAPGQALLLGLEAAEAKAAWEDFLGEQTQITTASEPVSTPGDAAGGGTLRLVIDGRNCSAGEKIATFNRLFPGLEANGLYLGTSALQGETERARLSAFFTGLLDDMHAFHKRGKQPEEFAVTELTRTVKAVHAYPGLFVIEREDRQKPQMVFTGEAQF